MDTFDHPAIQPDNTQDDHVLSSFDYRSIHGRLIGAEGEPASNAPEPTRAKLADDSAGRRQAQLLRAGIRPKGGLTAADLARDFTDDPEVRRWVKDALFGPPHPPGRGASRQERINPDHWVTAAVTTRMLTMIVAEED